MRTCIGRLVQFVREEDGPTSVEYAVMLVLIIVFALGAITLLGTKVNSVFGNASTTLPDGT